MIQSNRLRFVCFVLSLIAGIFFRFSGISERMTHIDDIGFLDHILDAHSSEEGAKQVAGNWTYAPAQFGLTWQLIQNAEDWPDLLMRARLPSAIFATIGFCLFAGALLLIDRGRLRWSSLISLAICGFSCHALIEAQQGYVYAATFFAAAWGMLGITLLFLKGRTPWQWVSLAAVVVLPATRFIYLSYQNIFLLPGLFVGVALSLFCRPRSRREWLILAMTMIALLAYAGTQVHELYFSRLLPLQKAGYPSMPWWAQEDKLVAGSSILVQVVNVTTYVVHRFGNYVFYQMTPIWPSSVSPLVIALVKWIAASTILIGFLKIVPTKTKIFGNDLYSAVRYGVTCSSVVHLSFFIWMNLLEKLPFGVTRHSHILLLSGAWLLKEGIESITARLSKGKTADVVGFVLWISVIGSFFAYRGTFTEMTKNNYDISFLNDVCRKQPIGMVYEVDWTSDFFIANKKFPGRYACKKIERLPSFNDLKLESRLNSQEPMLFSSHRFDLVSHFKKYESLPEFRNHQFTYLKDVPALGSTEPVGNINGGNGFYVVLIQRKFGG